MTHFHPCNLEACASWAAASEAERIAAAIEAIDTGTVISAARNDLVESVLLMRQMAAEAARANGSPL